MTEAGFGWREGGSKPINRFQVDAALSEDDAKFVDFLRAKERWSKGEFLRHAIAAIKEKYYAGQSPNH